MPTRRDFEDDFGDPDRNARGRWSARIAHVILPVTVITMSARIVEYFINLPMWLSITASVLFTLVFFTAIVHQSLARICLRCMEEVPADAPVRAQQKRWALRIEHFTRSWKLYGSMWGLIILAQLALQYLLYRDLPANDVHNNWIGAPSDLALSLVIYGMVQHHRMQPWCPFCRRWDEGGDHECTPTPDPSATKVA